MRCLTWKEGVRDGDFGAGVELEVGVGGSGGTRVRISRTSSQSSESWMEGTRQRAHQLERGYVFGDRRRRHGSQVMTREGALEVHNGKATLKGGRQGCQRWGLPTGPDGPFHVRARLPGVRS